MPPGATQAAVTEGHQDADSNHARMSRLLLVTWSVDESAETRMLSLVHEVYQVIGDSVQTGWQALILDEALEFDSRSGLFPNNGIASFDIKVDEKEGGYGRELGLRIARRQAN